MRFTVLITIVAIMISFSPLYSDNLHQDNQQHLLQEKDNRLVNSKWRGGPYFLSGIGLSGTLSITNETRNRSYGGCHLLAALGYWAYNAFGIEVGAFINYSYFHNMTVYNYIEISSGTYQRQRVEGLDAHMWDSSFYFAVMFRWPFMEPTDVFNIYLKLFNGYGKSVFWLRDTPDDFFISDYDRFYSEGPIFGLAIGNLFNAFNEGTVWYIQFTIITKVYRETIALRDGGVLPVEIATYDNTNNNHLVQLHLTVGFRLY